MRHLTLALSLWIAAPLWAADLSDLDRWRLLDAQIVFLGEVHDNPAHHEHQTRLTDLATPKAIVFEMLDEAQASVVTPGLLPNQELLEIALGWTASGWPDFAMYYPIFTAVEDVAFYVAAVPRDVAREAMEAGAGAVFGAEAHSYGLMTPLDAPEQVQRLALQQAAHCNALPEEMLPGMVNIQRLRDATLAQRALQALEDTGGPVIVITGNGHARTDWGAPAYVARVAPAVSVFALGQSEDGSISGKFDAVVDAPGIKRPDPCDALKKG